MRIGSIFPLSGRTAAVARRPRERHAGAQRRYRSAAMMPVWCRSHQTSGALRMYVCLYVCITACPCDGAEVQSLTERVQLHSSELSEHCEEQVCLITHRVSSFCTQYVALESYMHPVTARGIASLAHCPFTIHALLGASPSCPELHRNRQEQAPARPRGGPRARQGPSPTFTPNHRRLHPLIQRSAGSSTNPNTDQPQPTHLT